RVVDVELIHVVHVTRQRGVERLTEEQQSPGGTKRFGALSTVGDEESDAPGREGDDCSAELLTVVGKRVDLRGGRRRQRSANDQPRILEAVQSLGEYGGGCSPVTLPSGAKKGAAPGKSPGKQ